jgi:cytochrome c oxidase cbb3-type subunit 2
MRLAFTLAAAAAAAAAGGLLLAGCADDDWGPEKLGLGHTDSRAATLQVGRVSYATYCAGCHGERGDGHGPAMRFLDPKPRDFRQGRLKFASVAAGSAPHDEDYLRTINRGLAGTAMPAFPLIPEDEKRALVAYLRTFVEAPEEPAPVISLPEAPWIGNADEGIAEGERVYHSAASCHTCHPAYLTRARLAEVMTAAGIPVEGDFREDLYEPVPKDSEWGAPIRPPDFLRDRVKAGTARRELALTIATGVGGTAMPTWGTALPPEQLWGLAYYVETLVSRRGSRAGAELRQALLTQPVWTPPAPPPATTTE